MRLLLLLIASVASLEASTVAIQLVSFNDIFNGAQYVMDRGAYVGPFTVDINGATSIGMSIDFASQPDAGDSWRSFQTPVTSTGMKKTDIYSDNKHDRNVDAITFEIYEEEAYLYRQMVAALLPTDRAAIQEAAWALGDPTFAIGDSSEALQWLAAARNPDNYQHVDLNGLFVFTDVQGGVHGNFEFIGGTPEAVPEPRALGFLAGAIVLAALVSLGLRRHFHPRNSA